jgi:hypothetical protein
MSRLGLEPRTLSLIGIGEPALPWYTTAMVTDALLDSFPVSRYDASVAEVLNEIAEYQQLHADWDAEGALPVAQVAARLASWLVQMVAHTSRHQGIPWQAPVAGPNADGGINLEWQSEDRGLFVMIRPGERQLVECLIEEADTQPRRETLSVWDTIDLALWAMGSQ